MDDSHTMVFGTPGPESNNIDYTQTDEGFDIVENGVVVFHVVTHAELRSKPLIMQIASMGLACDQLRAEIAKKIQSELMDMMRSPLGSEKGQ